MAVSNMVLKLKEKKDSLRTSPDVRNQQKFPNDKNYQKAINSELLTTSVAVRILIECVAEFDK